MGHRAHAEGSLAFPCPPLAHTVKCPLWEVPTVHAEGISSSLQTRRKRRIFTGRPCHALQVHCCWSRCFLLSYTSFFPKPTVQDTKLDYSSICHVLRRLQCYRRLLLNRRVQSSLHVCSLFWDLRGEHWVGDEGYSSSFCIKKTDFPPWKRVAPHMSTCSL